MIMCNKSCDLDTTIVYDNSTSIVATSLHIRDTPSFILQLS